MDSRSEFMHVYIMTELLSTRKGSHAPVLILEFGWQSRVSTRENVS